MQGKQGILAGDSLNSTNSSTANTHVCVDIYIYISVTDSVCRIGMQIFYLAPKHEVLNTKGLCLLVKLIQSVKTSSTDVLHTVLLGL